MYNITSYNEDIFEKIKHIDEKENKYLLARNFDTPLNTKNGVKNDKKINKITYK